MENPATSAGRRRAWGTTRAPAVVIQIVFMVLLCVCAPQARASSDEDRAARAATIVRMLRFVDWAEDAPGRDLRVAVVGDPALGAALREAGAGVQPGGRTVTVVDVASPRALPEADAAVVVVGSLPAGHAALVRQLAGHAVLTVGDGNCPDDTELMLNLLADGRGYRVQANPAAAARAGVSLSSRLLRLAHIVE